MRFLEILNEGIIDVSGIVTEAESLLASEFKNIIFRDAKKWISLAKYNREQLNKQYELDGPDDYGPYFQMSDAMEEYKKELKRGFSAAYTCLYDASKFLTNLVQEKLKEYVIPTKPTLIIIDGAVYPLEHILVKISIHNEKERNMGYMFRGKTAIESGIPNASKEENRYKRFCGIKVFVKPEPFLDVYVNALEMQIHEICYGSDSEYAISLNDYIEQLVDDIVPIFAHELDHLIYFIKKQQGTTFFQSNEITNIKAGNKSRRYDIGFGHENIHQNYRYYGSNIELQAWASGAAAELHRKYKNYSIDEIINDIKSGNNYISSSLWTYHTEIQGRFKPETGSEEASKQYNQDLKLNEEEFKKVWNKFLKLVVMKLLAYKAHR